MSNLLPSVPWADLGRQNRLMLQARETVPAIKHEEPVAKRPALKAALKPIPILPSSRFTGNRVDRYSRIRWKWSEARAGAPDGD